MTPKITKKESERFKVSGRLKNLKKPLPVTPEERKRRTYRELQMSILKALRGKEHTTYEISQKTDLHFHVVQRQLIRLKGQDYITLIFEHNQFKLFGITDKGIKHLRKITR
ncbi:MAG: winged helix-turn-helix domain-containing protein [Nanoarchaeota archaeon]|nr:winged helix-turn-helix domain-containing protein [Nanoarchaeota archaeon]